MDENKTTSESMDQIVVPKTLTFQEYQALLQTTGGRDEVAMALENMMNGLGWKIVEMVLSNEIIANERILHDIKADTTAEDWKKARDRLYYIQELLDTPSALAKNARKPMDEKIISEVELK